MINAMGCRILARKSADISLHGTVKGKGEARERLVEMKMANEI
jgi:hypothetical protein